ncbi:putative U-box domain-containing protein 42 isoform X2 [Ziziphus jujuba]|uniref:RING-type E3 ubiquitin transferase n=1 Tax=Ziziphus jujuba TaxID=326968 RepID=A0A6P6GI94_ZIZJJ|nr:putative U-box domain-containing protein 42 isoform X2 [Ziziphus jujuba]
MKHKQEPTLANSVADSLLASISGITVSVVCIEIEQETFIEFGCYLYRASIVVMELKTTENSPPNTIEILQSLSKSIDLAKEILERCQKGTQPISNSELGSIIVQLEEVIKHMGESLSLIPSSTFKDQEYAELAVNSLSKEMQNVCFASQTSPRKDIDMQMLSLDEQAKKELTRTETETETERDLYSINVEFSMDNPYLLDAPYIVKSASSSTRSSRVKQGSMSSSIKASQQVAQFMEPMYETFFCPLTKKIMDEPVTIESGITYEKKAIIDLFEKHGNTEEVFCPVTSQKLVSRVFNSNIALKCTIEQWKERNEVARIKVARTALSLASSEQMVLEAIKDVQTICQGKPQNKLQVQAVGMLPLIIRTLEYEDTNVRFAALELLQKLAEDDDDSKEMIAEELDFSLIIKLLSCSHQPLRHSSLLLLLELSKSQYLCDKIGLVPGVILMLITIKYKPSTDVFASEKANETLKNLERSPTNVKLMAENGFLEPLLYNLVVGNEEIKTEMASYLGETVLEHDSRTYVAEKVSPSLIGMVHSGNPLTRMAAFKALSQMSSYQPNGKILIEAGIVQIMAEEMFTRRIYDELMDSKIEAAAILANIFESGLEHENLRVNSHGHTMASDYVVYNIIYMLRNSTPDELNVNLIRILSCLTKYPKSMATIISLVKEIETSFTLIELINNPHEELAVATIKLLIMLTPNMGHTLADRLCKTRGQPENLIQIPNDVTRITEKQAVSAKFLAELPHQNLTLNLALLFKIAVPTILQTISQIQRSGTRSSRYATSYLEGLVGILVRFTTTLYDPQILFLARTHNFTMVFSELLMKSSSDEVQRLSAIGLENLSSESINLSKPPQVKKAKFMNLVNLPKFLSFKSSRKTKITVCPVHRGDCSSENTFCLVNAKAVDRLLACLDHENAEVVEAALSALCTLLDDKVDVDKSVNMLNSVNAIRHVLNVVKEHRQDGLWQKSFWVIEKFLKKGGGQSASDISQDRLLPALLVSAFHHGDGNTRQTAEKILTHLNKMPSYNTSGYTM